MKITLNEQQVQFIKDAFVALEALPLPLDETSKKIAQGILEKLNEA